MSGGHFRSNLTRVRRFSLATARLPRPIAEEENEVKDHPINSDGPRLPALLVFDVNGTLSDMSELLRDEFALTVSGVAKPFARLGGEMLRVRLDDLDLERGPRRGRPARAGGFADLALHPDVAEGLNALATDQPHYGYAGTDTDEAPTKGLTLNALR